MLYNSDSFVVVRFEVAGQPATADGEAGTPASEGGYEIVDKFARKGIFLQGEMAVHFKDGVDALIASRPSEEEVDDYLERFASLMQQPMVVH